MWSVDYLVYRSSPAASRIALLDFLKGKDMLTRIAAPTVRCMQAYLDANVAVALPELVRPSVKGKNHGWDSPKPLGGSLGRWHWCGDGRLEVRYSIYIRLLYSSLGRIG